MPTPGEKYKHFKNEEMTYEIVAVANDCDNPSIQKVIYKQLYATKDFPKGTVWSRDLKNFIGYKRLQGDEKIKRFTKVQEVVKFKDIKFKDKSSKKE